MRMQKGEVKIDRKNTNFKKLLKIIDKVGGYPVMATDLDGTKLAIDITEGTGERFCSVIEPGDAGTIVTDYYEDGRVETHTV